MNNKKVNIASFELYIFLCISLLLTLIFPLYGLASEPDFSEEKTWTTWKENKDIKITYQKTKNTPLIEIKVNATIKSTLSGFLLFIQDTKNVPNWLENAKLSKVIKELSPQENLFITYFKSYWPVSKRYMVINSRHWQNDDLSVEIMLLNVSDKEYLLTDMTKIEVLKAHWHIKPADNGNIDIDYTIIADPKGMIPLWLNKRISLNSLWKTMNNIHKQLPKSVWQKHSLPYITETQMKKPTTYLK